MCQNVTHPWIIFTILQTFDQPSMFLYMSAIGLCSTELLTSPADIPTQYAYNHIQNTSLGIEGTVWTKPFCLDIQAITLIWFVLRDALNLEVEAANSNSENWNWKSNSFGSFGTVFAFELLIFSKKVNTFQQYRVFINFIKLTSLE